MVVQTVDASKEISKYTLEAVFQAQESLRKHLDILIREERTLNSDEERDLFYREITYATLGLGVQKIINYKIPSGFGDTYLGIRSDIETVARWLGDQEEHMVRIPLVLFGNKSMTTSENAHTTKVPIQLLWSELKYNLFSVFPYAIDRACKMSKEREERSGDSEFDINE